MMWATYAYTGVGNPGAGETFDDFSYWLFCMQSRCREIYDEYLPRFAAWDAFQRRALQQNSSGQYDPDMSSSSLESESVQKLYDPPQTNTAGEAATSYLDTQNVSTFKQKGYSNLDSATVREYNDNVKNPFRDFVEEFRPLFYRGL